MSSYKPLKRDRSAELQRLADRVGELVKGGLDPVMADDLYSRLARDWQRVPPNGAEDLEALQAATLERIGEGEDADERLRIYEFHVRELQASYQREIAVRDAEAAPPPPTRGQQAAAVAAGAVVGHFGYRMASNILSDIFRPVGTLLRLFR